MVLINGKRVNQQSQAYLNRTPGKGEVGVNLKSIPIAAVERIEVLRDGASSQYGSDAMAGVMNFILKKDSAFSTLNASTGITSAGDGFQFNIDYNTTLPFGNGGRVNLTLAYTDQERTNRAGAPGTSSFDTATARQNEIDFAIKDPTLGMIIGRPDLKQKNVFVTPTKDFYEVMTKSDVALDDSCVPIFNQILDIEAIELHKLTKILEKNNGKKVYLNTDCGIGEFNNLKDIKNVQKDMKAHFWDEEKRYRNIK